MPTTPQSAAPTSQPSTEPSTTQEPSLQCEDQDFVIPPFQGKKGIGMTLRDEGELGSWRENIPKIVALRPYWNYAWNLRRLDAQPDDIEFVPMAWGVWDLERFEEKLEEFVLPHTDKVRRIFGFNEPDSENQSNVNVSTAIRAWPALERTGLSLVSPSTTHAEERWMRQFMTRAQHKCRRVDWIGVHWYGAAHFSAFREHLISVHELYQQPLVLTEFAPADWNAARPEDNIYSTDQVLRFMKEALPWLEETEWIAGYAWFSFDITSPQGTSSALFDARGQLTKLGQFYASVRNDTPMGNQTIQ